MLDKFKEVVAAATLTASSITAGCGGATCELVRSQVRQATADAIVVSAKMRCKDGDVDGVMICRKPVKNPDGSTRRQDGMEINMTTDSPVNLPK